MLRQKSSEMDEAKNTLLDAVAKTEEVSKQNLRLKGNLDVRVAEVQKLKEELKVTKETCVEEIRKKNEHLVKVEQEFQELENNKSEVDKLRMKELEMLVEVREELAVMKDKADGAESAVRSMEAQQRLLQEAESRVAEFEAALEQWRLKYSEAEEVMKGLEDEKNQLEDEKSSLADQLEALQQMIEPYRDQLENFELERKALLAQNEMAEGEAKKLALQNGRLLGHQNHSQKIQYVVKIKQENVGLKSEVTRLTEELNKTRRQLMKTEEKLQETQGLKKFDHRLSFQPKPADRNKENSMVPPAKTPLAPSSGSKMSRHSTGSPLRVN